MGGALQNDDSCVDVVLGNWYCYGDVAAAGGGDIVVVVDVVRGCVIAVVAGTSDVGESENVKISVNINIDIDN